MACVLTPSFACRPGRTTPQPRTHVGCGFVGRPMSPGAPCIVNLASGAKSVDGSAHVRARLQVTCAIVASPGVRRARPALGPDNLVGQSGFVLGFGSSRAVLYSWAGGGVCAEFSSGGRSGAAIGETLDVYTEGLRASAPHRYGGLRGGAPQLVPKLRPPGPRHASSARAPASNFRAFAGLAAWSLPVGGHAQPTPCGVGVR